jgi:FkbM family methyltransferase
MDVKYYGQLGDDCLLWQFFQFKPTGYFVDVGAFDGIHLSNSYSFEQQNWRGICIEPHPDYYPLCAAARPGSICLEVACVGDDSQQQVSFQTESAGLFSGISVDEKRIMDAYKWRRVAYTGIKTVTVKARTLASVLDEYLPPDTLIDFISIDVEGTEPEVLRGLDLKRYRPRVLVVESNTAEMSDVIQAILHQAGYHHARILGVNHFYVTTPEDAAVMQSLQVNYEREKTTHPHGEPYTFVANDTLDQQPAAYRRYVRQFKQRLKRLLHRIIPHWH